MTENAHIQKLYIITQDKKGHIHHYVSSKASMHLDIVLEYDIDLDQVKILEKGFIFENHMITANYDIRGTKARQERKRRHDGTK